MTIPYKNDAKREQFFFIALAFSICRMFFHHYYTFHFYPVDYVSKGRVVVVDQSWRLGLVCHLIHWKIHGFAHTHFHSVSICDWYCITRIFFIVSMQWKLLQRHLISTVISWIHDRLYFVILTIAQFVWLQGMGAPHPSAAVPPPSASHDRGWIGILLGILAVLVLIIIVIVLLFYLRFATLIMLSLMPIPSSHAMRSCHSMP